MRIDAIQAFVTVAETGSFGAAALRLHVSQPAVSKRLAGLEERLGYRLLDRIGHRIGLTEAGRVYLPHARETLASLADGDRALDNLAASIEGNLAIALSHHVGMHRMPAVLRRFIAQYPAVSPQITFVDSELACQRVLNGESELAVMTLPVEPHRRLTAIPIWDDPLGLFVGPGHPLSDKPILSVAALSRYPAVLPPPASYTYGILRDAFAHAGAVADVRMTSHSLETLRMLADVGLGWTVLPRSMPHALVELHVPPIAMRRTLGVMRHPQRQLSNAASAMLAMLEQEAGALDRVGT